MRLASATRVGDRVRQAGRGRAGARYKGRSSRLTTTSSSLLFSSIAPAVAPDAAPIAPPTTAPTGPPTTAPTTAPATPPATAPPASSSPCASPDAVVRDVALDDSALSHGWISCRGWRRSTPLAHPSVLSERDEVMTVRHLPGHLVQG